MTAGYIFHKAQWLRREDKAIEAARLLQSAPRSASQQHNLDEWWIERRLVARKLLDLDEKQAAYLVARDALPPTKENLRAEHEFTAGWIALRFHQNPSAAIQHFARVGHGTTNPITLARGEYWQGRALEADRPHSRGARALSGRRAVSDRLLRQIARARLGMANSRCAARRTSGHRAALMSLEVRARRAASLRRPTRATSVISFVSDLADKAVDSGALVVVAEVASDTTTRARCCCSARPRSTRLRASTSTPSRPTASGIPHGRPDVDKSVVVRDRAAGKRLQSARGVERQCARPDAGPARHRQADRQEIRLRRSTATACCRTPPTTPRWAPPSSATCSRPIAAPTSSPSSPTTRAAAA
jgi:hypothetical protein